MLNYLLLFNKRLEFDLCFNSIQNSHVHEPSKLVENLQHLYITTEKNLTSNHSLNLKSLGFSVSIECFHKTSRRPFWCPKTMKQRPCWCPKPVLWELNSFLMQMPSFVPIDLHRCWARERKRSREASAAFAF